MLAVYHGWLGMAKLLRFRFSVSGNLPRVDTREAGRQIVRVVLKSTVRKWGEFIKFSHTVFALPFALASMAVAARDQHGWPGWRTFLLILAAMICARTCAMSFNRIADREFDRANPRTAGRHLPRGEVSLGGGVGVVRGGRRGLGGGELFHQRRLLLRCRRWRFCWFVFIR